ncbi:MAG: hypothetical protein H5U40_18680 [Polyangiaceae bacterium]|nr:hypothetical protein [Polyangiaceae bacterium]
MNEFGGVEGLVSIEDVLAEVFGEFGDEIKPDEPGPEMLPDGAVRLPGAMALEDAEEWLGRPARESATTVGGLVIERLGRLPHVGDELVEGEAAIRVVEMAPTAVKALEVRRVGDVEATREPGAS